MEDLLKKAQLPRRDVRLSDEEKGQAEHVHILPVGVAVVSPTACGAGVVQGAGTDARSLSFSVDCPWNMKYSPTGHPKDGGPVCKKAW